MFCMVGCYGLLGHFWIAAVNGEEQANQEDSGQRRGGSQEDYPYWCMGLGQIFLNAAHSREALEHLTIGHQVFGDVLSLEITIEHLFFFQCGFRLEEALQIDFKSAFASGE